MRRHFKVARILLGNTTPQICRRIRIRCDGKIILADVGLCVALDVRSSSPGYGRSVGRAAHGSDERIKLDRCSLLRYRIGTLSGVGGGRI
jgi:hypothetical protein